MQKFITPSMPRKLMIEPTNFCNVFCPTCPTGSGKSKREKRHMSLDAYKKIIDECEGHVADLTLWNYGEPFLNSHIFEMIQYASSKGMNVITSTNGQFFTSLEYCEKIVQSGLNRMLICLDGADQQTINQFRKNADFEKILNGIQWMMEAKRKLNAAFPRIEIQFIVMKHNEHQKETIRNLAKELNVDGYSEKTVGIDANDPEFQKMCQDYLPRNLDLSRYDQKEDGQFTLKGTFSNYCSTIYTTMVINSNGSVVPCCYDLYDNHILGNILKNTIRSIWKGTKYQDFRRQVRKSRKTIPICNICSEGMPISKRDQLN